MLGRYNPRPLGPDKIEALRANYAAACIRPIAQLYRGGIGLGQRGEYDEERQV